MKSELEAVSSKKIRTQWLLLGGNTEPAFGAGE